VEFGTVVFLLAIGGVVWAIVGRSKRRAQQTTGAAADHEAQDLVERKILQFMAEVGDRIDDAAITQLVHDELVLEHARHPAVYAWATVEHVARIRRRLHLEMARRSHVLPPAVDDEGSELDDAPGSNVARIQTCKQCGKKARRDALRCLKCRAWLSAAKA
jgi:hypothetical protein